MPPKVKFTKEEMIQKALQLVSQEGIEHLTARGLSSRLGCSVKPIFGLFQNMDEVQDEVMKAAERLYQSFLATDMAKGEYPPYKAGGMAYIRFAREEPHLFRQMFMRDRSGERIEEDRSSVDAMLDMLQQRLEISRDEAYLLHLELWIYVHGIATMIVTGYIQWDEKFISGSLSDVYKGLIARYQGKGVE